MYSEKDNIGNW